MSFHFHDEDAYAEGPSVFFYQDANGIQHESYDAACHYYGVDTPAQLEAEEAYYAELEEAEYFDRLFNDAVVISAFEADAILHPEPDYCPF